MPGIVPNTAANAVASLTKCNNDFDLSFMCFLLLRHDVFRFYPFPDMDTSFIDLSQELFVRDIPDGGQQPLVSNVTADNHLGHNISRITHRVVYCKEPWGESSENCHKTKFLV